LGKKKGKDFKESGKKLGGAAPELEKVSRWKDVLSWKNRGGGIFGKTAENRVIGDAGGIPYFKRQGRE